MNDIEKNNKEIAKMLGWIDADGDLVVPHHLSNGYNYSEWADTKYIKRDDLYKGCTICHYINVTQEGFSSDWNWLMEAVEFVQKIIIQKSEEFIIELYKNLPNEPTTFVNCGYNEYQHKNPKEAVFQAVSEFAKKYNNKEL
jgi:hypothetical protein